MAFCVMDFFIVFRFVGHNDKIYWDDVSVVVAVWRGGAVVVLLNQHNCRYFTKRSINEFLNISKV